MDIRFEDNHKKGRSPSTRLYMPGQEDHRVPEPRAPRTRPGARNTAESGVRVVNPRMTGLGRFGLIVSGFLFAGMVLFTLSGYERISRAYADINVLRTEIESTNLRIRELDVQIECAVTIQDAQKIAEAYGMKYPEKNQYVRIGDPLPFDNILPTPTEAPTEDATTEPDTAPDMTNGLDTSGGGGQPPAGG